MEREPNTEYVLSLSYGKDSLACLGAIEELGWPLDRIIHAEVWATDDIPADLPPMVSFKNHADEIIRERFGIEVEHLCATRNGEKLTYEKLFYHIPKRKNGGNFKTGSPAGFPYTKGAWCNDRLKTNPLDATSNSGGGRVDGWQRHGGVWSNQYAQTISLAASPSQSGAGARNSKTGLILGFPIIKGNWCTSDLKRRVFHWPHCTRGKDKYCAVPRNCC